ncbi:zinc finger protein 880-like [Contarinia nasturtii]|uniref:zinc finger protein 880-like n=1 Tax=Contarinia nasturtii TaxID=265458 RepID=UPI0012D49E60|nr:zinc finger protein 880-like [Contarinia nasturtii]
MNAVHQCLFCPQTFGTAAEKDDHVLEHFAQETCAECDQNLIRIGSNLYTLHSAVTCIKTELKIEPRTATPLPSVNYSGYKTETEDDVTTAASDNEDWSTTFSMIKESICTDELQVKVEPNNEYEQQNVTNDCDWEIEIKPRHLIEVVGEYEHGFESTQSDSEIKPQNEEQSINSIEENKRNRKSSCEICGKILLTTSLVLHKKTQHAPPGSYICRICYKELPNEQELSKHHADCLSKTRKKVRCNDCGKMFNKSTIARHKRAFHSPEGTPVCKRCGKIFSNEGELSLHRSVCLLKRKPIEKGHFECDICKKVLSSKKCVKQHINFMHNPEYQKKTQIPCNICGKIMGSDAIYRHRAVFHSDASTYVCKLCGKKSPNEAALLSHKTECLKKASRKIPCNICGKVLNKSTMARHKVINHSGAEAFVCKLCAKIFPNDEELQNHKPICPTRQRQLTKFPCDICGKLLVITAIPTHKRVKHSESGTPVCKMCSKICANEEELATHKQQCWEKRKNKGWRKKGEFECEFCKKIFCHKHSLHNHLKAFHNYNSKTKQNT